VRRAARVTVRSRLIPDLRVRNLLWRGDVLEFLRRLPTRPLFDLVVTSPPYNIGKSYETRVSADSYVRWQREVIGEILCRVKDSGSICWQVGSASDNGSVAPLDYLLHPVFQEQGLVLRNRIIWHFGHGLHRRNRFSGRYEVVLWYTKGDDYVFNLDPVRIPSKYPGKRSYRGPNYGELSSHPLGKNPEDVWDIPNVKGRHVEKTAHPCQFPVGLIERLVLALTNRGALVFDPFCGVGSAGVAAAIHSRRFWGADVASDYLRTAKGRISAALAGRAAYRPHDREIFDHRRSSLSRRPIDE